MKISSKSNLSDAVVYCIQTTADCVKMDIKERMKLMPLESIVGGAMCIVATIIYGFLG